MTAIEQALGGPAHGLSAFGIRERLAFRCPKSQKGSED
jgi:hypothetical protein